MFFLVTELPLSALPSYKFGFRSSVQKNGPPGEGRQEGLIPRNDVLTNGFIRFSLARTLAPLFECKSGDDGGAGKLRELLTLHTNPHAVHGRFTLKDDCERQVWNAGAVS